MDKAVDKMLKNKFNQSLSPYLNRPLRSLHEVLGNRLEKQPQGDKQPRVNCTRNDLVKQPESARDTAV